MTTTTLEKPAVPDFVPTWSNNTLTGEDEDVEKSNRLQFQEYRLYCSGILSLSEGYQVAAPWRSDPRFPRSMLMGSFVGSTRISEAGGTVDITATAAALASVWSGTYTLTAGILAFGGVWPSSTLTIREQIQALNAIYIFVRPGQVYRFLRRHDFLVDLLFEIKEQITRFFGSGPTLLSLRVVVDPENSKDRQLLLSIGTSRDPEEALQVLGKFDLEWWLEAAGEAAEFICISLEYQ
jgi:hypothetical protein